LAEKILGATVLVAIGGHGGRTTIPKQVMEALKLHYSSQKREKLLWTQEGEEVIVTKGTPQSDFRKTILSRGDTAAVPKHICEALKLMPQKKKVLYGFKEGKISLSGERGDLEDLNARVDRLGRETCNS
jgi:hypothetical protein